MPDLSFGVVDAEAVTFAASPTILFKLHIENGAPDEQIDSIMLHAQVRIEAARRHYDSASEVRLFELFGEPRRWGETLRSVLWAQANVVVPRFRGNIVAELPIPCTYDFEVASAKYFDALVDGEVPLLFLFSGTIFYRDGEAMRATQVPWEKEATFRMPVGVWKDTMARYFPNSAWLRLRKDVFDRLYAYKARHALPTWEDALERLLSDCEANLESSS